MAHLDQRYAPKNTWHIDLALASIDAIARLRRDGATVFRSHDADQWAGLRSGAAFYD